MPLPIPKKNETQDDFISRCMSSDVMNSEFPDNKQRAAVCHSQWKKAKKTSIQKAIIGTPYSFTLRNCKHG